MDTLESIPSNIRASIGAQEGLKVDMKPVSSLGDLTYTLLSHRHRKSSSRVVSAPEMAVDVLRRFYSQIWGYRNGIIDKVPSLTALVKGSHKIMPCKAVLGSFMIRFQDPKGLILQSTFKTSERGYRSPRCNKARMLGIPFDELQY